MRVYELNKDPSTPAALTLIVPNESAGGEVKDVSRTRNISQVIMGLNAILKTEVAYNRVRSGNSMRLVSLRLLKGLIASGLEVTLATSLEESKLSQ